MRSTEGNAGGDRPEQDAGASQRGTLEEEAFEVVLYQFHDIIQDS